MMNRRAKIAISTSVALCGVQIVVAEPADTLQRTKVLSEVVVTASESRKATSASRIDVTALKHLQPSSFTDILELLPGGRAVDPAMGTVNSIRLREAGKDATSDISSLGVSFVVDGVTLNADANMQYITGTYLGSGLSSVSKGVDMRTISTDNIESVEVVRGIPSVAYGNITSGTVIINRRSSASPFSARFKADLKSRLLSVGKGIVTDASGCRTLNIDLNYLDSKITPTDSRKNFSRITASARFVSRSIGDNGAEVRWNVATDYTGSFDCIKHDKDATSKIDEFRSRYNSFSLSGGMSLKAPPRSLLKEVNVKTSFKQEFDLMTESRSVAIDRPMAIPCSTEEGEAYGIYLPYSYDACMKVDGKPFYANVSADAKLGWQCEPIFSYMRIGAEWTMSANNGEGQVYDALRPLTAEMLDDVNYDRVLEIYKERFADASDFSMILVGNIDIDELRHLLCRYVASLPAVKGKKETFGKNVPEIRRVNETRIFRREQSTPSTLVGIYFTADVKCNAHNDLMLDVLAQVMRTIYTEKVREEKGGTYGVSVAGQLDRFPNDEATLKISFRTSPEKYDELIPIIYSELKNVAANGVPAEILEKVKKFQVKNYKQNILTNGYWDYVLYHSVFTGVDFDKDYVKMVESLTSADVKNFARKLLKPGNRIEVTMTTGKS